MFDHRDEPSRAPGWELGQRLRGRALRQACVFLLTEARQPCTVSEITKMLAAHGYTTVSQPPHKAIADCLRYEVQQHRVVRIARATYWCRPLPATTLRRYRHLFATSGKRPLSDLTKLNAPWERR